MRRVLVTGVGGGVGQGIVKALRRFDGPEVEIVAADMDPMAAGLYVADRAVLLPGASDPGYVDALVETCRAHDIAAYVPGTDVELEVAGASAASIEQHTGAVVVASPPSVVAVADDKAATSAWLAGRGYPHAATWEPHEVIEDPPAFPLVVKPRRGYRSIGVDVVTTPDELRAALGDRDDDPIVQTCVAGPEDEYTCSVVVAGDEVSPVLPLRRTLRAGDTYRAVPVDDERITDLVSAVVVDLGVQGPCNLQLRLDGDRPTIFELNPRFSGTTPFCAALGFNPVEWCLSRRWGAPYEPDIRWDAVILRHWAEVVVPADQPVTLAARRVVTPEGVRTIDLGPDRA